LETTERKTWSKKFKQEFTQKTFESDPVYLILGEDGLENEENYEMAFKAFKIRHAKLVTA